MLDNLPALLGTAGWVVVVATILVLFGRTEGGGWSIAGSVARGVTSWAGSRAASRAAAAKDAVTAETEDLGTRPT